MVSQATTIVLAEAFGPGVLGGKTTAIIPAGGSGATITGSTYSQFANDVVLGVGVSSGVDLMPDEVTVDVALTAVGANGSPHTSVKLKDPSCSAPTPEAPTCGQLLLPNGANGRVTMSIGSCDGLGPCRTAGGTEALVVTAIANLKDAEGTRSTATLRQPP